MKLFAAPLQGFTEAPWHYHHARIYGGADEYYTPFLRVEKGDVRAKDERDILPQQAPSTVPQIIFRDISEFEICREVATRHGYSRIDLNLGCPYPPQVKHGRGSGTLANAALLKEISEYIRHDTATVYSIKMRLGINEADEWKGIIDILNDTPLAHICLHPRTARQQYNGEIHTLQFEAFMAQSYNPVVYNGEIVTPEQIEALKTRYPKLHGIMAGRGLLARPSMFNEYASNKAWTREERIESLMRLHSALLDHYTASLCGETQVLSKIKPMWEYMGDDIDRKILKAIKKATTLDKYSGAIASIG